MTRTDIIVSTLLFLVTVVGYVAWVWLGGLKESGAWGVPEEAISSLDWMTKMTFGSFLTTLVRQARNSSSAKVPLEP